MKTKQDITILTSLLFSLIFIACPEPPENHPNDPRDYTWTIDTLAYPNEYQTKMSNIWGSSENDVYTVGHCTTIKGTMWHYDGVTWEPVILAKSIGGNIVGHHGIENIFGFSDDDVWAVGYYSHSFNYEGLVIHYDGFEWQEMTKLPTERLTAVWGTSSNDLWVGGFKDGLFHYDGTTWTQDSIPIPEAYDTTSFSMFDRIIGYSSDNIYAKYRSGQETAWILKYNGTSWQIIDRDSNYRYKDIWVSSDGTLFSVGVLGLSRWTGLQPETIYENNDEYYFHEIFGTDDSNIFLYSYKHYEHFGVIHHYNGEDLYNYPSIAYTSPWSPGIWANNRETFIITRPIQSSALTLIYHGR